MNMFSFWFLWKKNTLVFKRATILLCNHGRCFKKNKNNQANNQCQWKCDTLDIAFTTYDIEVWAKVIQTINEHLSKLWKLWNYNMYHVFLSHCVSPHQNDGWVIFGQSIHYVPLSKRITVSFSAWDINKVLHYQ